VPGGPPPPPPLPQPVAVPASLRLEFLDDPVRGLDKTQPHFSWVLPTPTPTTARLMPGALQSAAEVVLHEGGRQIWRSGQVNGSTPVLVPASPLPLQSDRAYTWAVRVWGKTFHPSEFSANASFTTGLLRQSDWGEARWIIGGDMGEARMLRKTFTISTPVSSIGRVSLFVSACQYVTLYLDGKKIGDHELDTVWTKFAENRSYVSYELDKTLLAPGQHVLGMELGQGFCGGSYGKASGEGHTRAGLLRLALHDVSPESKVTCAIISDDSWMVSKGPVLWDSTYYGEDYDARLEQPGWATVGFQPDTDWTAATVQTRWPTDDSSRTMPPAAPYMSSQLMQPIRAVREIPAVSMHKINIGIPCRNDALSQQINVGNCSITSWIYDFAQEFAGVARLKLPPLTKAGTNISLMYAEALAHPGLASRATLDAWNNGGGGKTPLCTYYLLPVTCYLLHSVPVCVGR
jgi:alpha-L-rhamnosidase